MGRQGPVTRQGGPIYPISGFLPQSCSHLDFSGSTAAGSSAGPGTTYMVKHAMRRLQRRTAPSTAIGRPARRALASSGAVVLLLAGTTAMRPAPPGADPAVTASPSSSATTPASATGSSSFRTTISPDLLVIEPSGLSARQLAKLSAAAGVRQVVTADGAAVKLNGHRVNVLGVNPGQFRSWTPLATATNQRLWTAVGQGRFVTSNKLAGRRNLQPGTKYLITGARQER